ncbi:MAG: hypothetical protein EH225_08300, partial [Calditrichaeota bacterium]
IVYFSGTGNTLLVARYLKKKLDEITGSLTELVPVEEAVPEQCLEDTILGLGFPVYDLQAPEIIRDYIASLPVSRSSRPVFLFSTYGLMARDCLSRTALLLSEKNYQVIAGRNFRAPGPALSFYTPWGENKLDRKKGFEKGIASLIGKYAGEVVQSASRFPQDSGVFRNRLKPFSRFWQKISNMTFGNTFYRNLKISDACVNCGKCVSICPAGNLQPGERKPAVMRDNGCLRCLRCVQVCVARAVNFTSARRRGDYPRKKVEEVFNHAIGSSMDA